MFIIGLVVIAFLQNVWHSHRHGEKAPADPWDGRTLEWSVSSPPPEYNFIEIPTVTGLDQLWIDKKQNGIVVSDDPPAEDRSIHLPQPSYWPFVCSMGLLIAGYGAVYISSIIGMVVTAIGFMTTMFAVYAWSFEPVNDPEDSH